MCARRRGAGSVRSSSLARLSAGPDRSDCFAGVCRATCRIVSVPRVTSEEHSPRRHAELADREPWLHRLLCGRDVAVRHGTRARRSPSTADCMVGECGRVRACDRARVDPRCVTGRRRRDRCVCRNVARHTDARSSSCRDRRRWIGRRNGFCADRRWRVGSSFPLVVGLRTRCALPRLSERHRGQPGLRPRCRGRSARPFRRTAGHCPALGARRCERCACRPRQHSRAPDHHRVGERRIGSSVREHHHEVPQRTPRLRRFLRPARSVVRRHDIRAGAVPGTARRSDVRLARRHRGRLSHLAAGDADGSDHLGRGWVRPLATARRLTIDGAVHGARAR